MIRKIGVLSLALILITSSAFAQYVSSPASSTGGTGTPGGSNGQIQYNNSGAFGGINLSAVGTSAIAIGSSAITTGVALDLGSTTSSLLLPIGTTGTRPATGVNGMLRYNSTATPGLEAYVNGAWTCLNCVGDTTKIADYAFTANDMGGYVNLSGSHTLTVPAITTSIFAANQISCYSNQGVGIWTISTTPTINGLPSTSVYPGGGGCLVSNGTSIDWQPGSSGLSASSLVTTVIKTANYSLQNTDTGTTFVNTGAAGSVTFTETTAATGVNNCFIADAAQTIIVASDTGHTIRNGTSVSASSGNFTSNGAIGALICIQAINSTEWYVTKLTGTWTVN